MSNPMHIIDVASYNKAREVAPGIVKNSQGLQVRDTNKNNVWLRRDFCIGGFGFLGALATFTLMYRGALSDSLVSAKLVSASDMDVNHAPIVTGYINDQVVGVGSFSFQFNSRDIFLDADNDALSIDVVTDSNTSWLNKNINRERGFLGDSNTPSSARDIKVIDNLAYIADFGSDAGLGLKIFDVADKTNPNLLGFYDTPDLADHIEVKGNIVYVADQASGMQIIDVSDPSNPTFLGAHDTSGFARDVFVQEFTAYIAGGFSGLIIVDVSDPTSPSELSAYNTPGQSYGVTVLNGKAYIADFDSGLQIVDVTDPLNPSFVGSYDTPGEARAVEITNNIAYVADYNLGLQVIDVSDPINPTLLSWYNTPGYAEGVVVRGKTVYVADGYVGVQAIDVSDPTDLRLAFNYETASNAKGVDVIGSTVYVAAYTSMAIFDAGSNTVITVSGEPEKSGTYPIEIKASDDFGNTVSAPFNLIVSRFPLLREHPTLTTMGGFLVSIGLLSAAVGSYKYRAQFRDRVNLTKAKLFTSPIHNLTLIPKAELELGKVLASGGFGTVYAGKWNTMAVAIKQFHFNANTEGAIKTFVDETEVMASLTHPSIVTVYGLGIDEANNVSLVMKLIRGGSLLERLQSKKSVNQLLQIRIALDIAYGLRYLHRQFPPILHRDIKSENVLLEKDIDGKLHGKLTDFGLAKVKAALGKQVEANEGNAKEAAGTLPWMAPELFQGKSYTPAADVYSFGMVLWELVTRKIPFEQELKNLQGMNRAVVKEAFKKLKISGKQEMIPDDTPEALASIIGDCWSMDPKKRPSLDNIIERLKTYENNIELKKHPSPRDHSPYKGNLNSSLLATEGAPRQKTKPEGSARISSGPHFLKVQKTKPKQKNLSKESSTSRLLSARSPSQETRGRLSMDERGSDFSRQIAF